MRGPGRGALVANEMRRLSGLNRDINAAIRDADKAIKDVQVRLYKPLEEKFAAVDDPEILTFLSQPEIQDNLRKVIPRGRPIPEHPSFENLQKLRTRLRAKDRDMAAQLDELMKDKLTGLAQADQEYAKARGIRRAFEIGRRTQRHKINGVPVALKSAADVERVMNDLAPEARKPFLEGRMHEIRTALEKHNKDAPAMLKQFLDAGPETQRIMRQMFPSEENLPDVRQDPAARAERAAARDGIQAPGDSRRGWQRAPVGAQ